MRKSFLLVLNVVLLVGTLPHVTRSQGLQTYLNKVYADESHCLLPNEVRADSDKPISCYCRDAIVDVRYVWENYLVTRSDPNLNGAYWTLEIHARRMCSKHYDVLDAIRTNDWQWNGPQVTRKYPAQGKIEKIKPDSRGFRKVEYEVQLTYRDRQGHVTKVENFTAFELLPPVSVRE